MVFRSDGSDAEEQVFCTVRADELPEEPKPSFLMRQTQRKEEEPAEEEGEIKKENEGKRRYVIGCSVSELIHHI